jgi:hypothetical protein
LFLNTCTVFEKELKVSTAPPWPSNLFFHLLEPKAASPGPPTILMRHESHLAPTLPEILLHKGQWNKYFHTFRHSNESQQDYTTKEEEK